MIIATPRCGAGALARESDQQGSAAPLLLTAREAQQLEEMQAMDRWATAVGNGDLAEIDNSLADMNGR